ncbi:MAG: caspase family protein, partial [Acidimicrobiia bacterium]|nr:caspase family protein [Acidimicrobiia bacterium]
MGDVYALLVGIDAYLPPVNALYGCRNDMAAFEQYLTARVGDRLRLATLYDVAATRAAVIDTFRAHLGQAGAGDVALFAYAGHGSEEPAPAAVVAMEPTGRIQTLMVHDCGRRVDGKLVRAIADKELAVLITEVATKGAHTAIILDCCHSGGGTRDPESSVRGWIARPESVDAAERALVAELAAPRPDDDLLPGALDCWPAPPTPHVALAACHSFETAKEHRVGDVTRGAFSVGLVGALETLGTRTTYRSLLNTVRARVSRTAEAQVPELWPLDAGSLGDALFLDGTVTPVPATFTMSHGFDGWELDAGLVHGLRAPVGDDAFVVACTPPGGGRTPAGVARVTTVEIGRSMVEPIGWTPEDVAYAAVITEVPLPPGEVQLDEPADDLDPAVAARVRDAVRAAVASAGANGGPSPHLRV